MNFPWSKNSRSSDSEEKRWLERELTAEVGARKSAEKQIVELKNALDTAESRLRQALLENNSIVRQHADKITALVIEHSKSMGEAKDRYDRNTESLKQGHKSDVEILTMNHSHEVSRLQKEINKLVGQLLVNQDDNQAWPDDKLMINYRELQRLIEFVTSPRNKEFLIPQNQQLGSHLDPTNFLSRAGRGKFHLVLKSTIWGILNEQFFCAPFGFGALGPGKAYKELMEVYSTWRKLFDQHPGTASANSERFAIFHQNELANKWRSVNFQYIGETLTANDRSNSEPDSLLVKLNSDSIRQTINRIMDILSQVSRLSNSSIKPEVEDKIPQIAHLARNIALQFGIQTAELRLLVPNYGEQIQIGEELHDCEDGDLYKGSTCVADMVIVPGLQKIGDGRSDMVSKRVIIPCEIYSHQPPS